MHVSGNPERKLYYMFYTDLHRAEGGYIQRIGRAVSHDLIRWGSYIELSISGVVHLTLVDTRFKGHNLGIYVEGSEVCLSDPVLHALDGPHK